MKTQLATLAIFSTIYANQVLAESEVQEVKIIAKDNTVKSIYILEDSSTGEIISYADACKQYPEYCPEKNEKVAEIKNEVKTETNKKSNLIVTNGMSGDFKLKGSNEKLERPVPVNGLSYIHHQYDLDNKEYVGIDARLDYDIQSFKYENQVKDKGVEIEIGTKRISLEGALFGGEANAQRIMHAIYVGGGYSIVETKKNTEHLSGIDCYQLPVKSKHIAQVSDNLLLKVEAGVSFLKCQEKYTDNTKKGNPWVVGIQGGLQAVVNVTDRLWVQASAEADPTVYDSSVRTKAVDRSGATLRLSVGYDLEKRRIQARSR